MSKTVDNRAVEMRFDNQQFEKGISQSTESLENLKKGLNLEGAAKGLNELGKVGKSFSLNSIGESVDYVASRFSALSLIGITALQNITNSALETGKRLLSSLTIDPIKTGLTEYETKMGAIQTILTNTASKGTKLEDVNRVLNELNKYSDQTIYNFAEMAKNIGTFTAAGVDLDTSATAIKGIANLAAGSGSTSLQASTAMYQLSQALAAGSVKLQDWNSVVNAGMGGELFQNALKDTAKQLGIMVDQTVPFRESLKDGWITAEVLTTTLEKFANDESLIKAATQVKTFTQLLDTMKESVQSGWAQTWEAIIGDKEQAAKLFTSINDAFGAMAGASAEARIELFKFWNEMGGRRMVIDGLSNALKGVQAILKPIGEAWSEVFPAMTGQRLVELSKAFQNLMREFKIGDETAANIKATFKGLFSFMDIGVQLISALAKGFLELLGYMTPVGGGLLDITASMGEFITNLSKTIRETNIFGDVIGAVSGFIKTAATNIKESFDKMSESFSGFGKFDTSVLSGFGKFFLGIGKVIGDTLGKLGTMISSGLDKIDLSKVLDLISGGLFASILLGLKNLLGTMSNIGTTGGGFLSNITGVIDGVKGSLESFQTQLKAGSLLKIAIAMGILAASLFLLSTIDSTKLASSLGAMSVMFIELFASLALFQKVMGPTGFIQMSGLVVTLLGVSVAILILSSAMTKLAELDPAKIAQGLLSIAALSATLVVTAKLLESNSGPMMKGALGLIAFAFAISMLADSVKKLGELDLPTLINGLVGVGAIMVALGLFVKLTETSKVGVGTGIALIALSTAILILAVAVKKFGEMSPAQLEQGLIALGVLLLQLAAFTRLTGNSTKVISTAIGLTILGGAMLIMAEALERFGAIPIAQIETGLASMAGMLTLLVIALRLMPKNMIQISLGLTVVAGALLIMSKVLDSLGKMTWEEIAKGLVALGGSLIIIAGAMFLMKTALPGAAALLVVAGALAILTPVILAFSKLSLAQIGSALLTLAGAFAVIGIAGLLLTPIIPSLIGLGIAISLLGVGLMAGGLGLTLFATGLAALSVSGTAGIVALTAIVTSLIGLIPMMLVKFGEGLIALAEVIKAGAPVIAEAFVAVVLAIIESMVALVPPFVDGVLVLLTAFLTTLAIRTPELIKQGSAFVRALIDGLAIELPALVQSGIDLMVSFINSLAEGIRNNSETIILAGQNLITALLEAMFLLLTTSLVDWEQLGKTIMESGFMEGVKKQIDAAAQIGSDLVKAVIKKITDMKDQFFKAGTEVVTGFIDGIKSKIDEAAAWAANLGKRTSQATANVLEIKSPSRVFKKIGQFSVEGLVEGLNTYASKAYVAAGDVGSKAISGLQNAIANISSVVGNSIDMEPTIRPILDLSDVSSGAKKISDMLSRNTSLNAATSISKASSVVTPTKYVKETASINESGPKAQQERSGSSMTVNMSVRSPAEAIKELDILSKKLAVIY